MKALELLGRLSLNMCIANPMERIAISGTDVYEAIIELEALQSRSCDGCKYGKERCWDWDSGRYDKDVSFECKRLDKSNQLTPYSKHEENKFYCSPTFCCNRYESKEQL